MCLNEASTFQTGHQLRQLFATILLYNVPTDTISLFNRYREYLSQIAIIVYRRISILTLLPINK